MTNHGDALANDDGLWGLLLGKKYDRIPQKDRTLENVVSEFYQGRKSIIDTKFGSKDDFISYLESVNLEEAKQSLRWIWAERRWNLQSRGDKFRVDSDIGDEIDRVGDEANAIVQNYEDGLTLVWPKKPVRRPEVQDGEVESRIRPEARPVFIRKLSNERVEIRGAKSRVRKFVSKFTDSPDVEPVELEPVNTSIVEGLSTVFTTEIETVRLVEAEFDQTYLPDNSGITVRNRDGIRRDLNSDSIKPEIIDDQSLTNLSRLKFIHTKSDKTFTLKAYKDDDGIYFDVQDNNIPETDKENIADVLGEQLGIYLNSVYRYDAQLHDDYIINQILAGNYNHYDRYFDELPDEKQAFLQRFVEVIETEVYECYQCHTEYEREIEECECGNDTFRDSVEFALHIDDESILDTVENQLEDFGSTIETEDFMLRDFSVERDERTYNTYLNTSFFFSQTAGMASDDYYSNYYVFCLGNRSRLPRRIGDYLLDTVLVTYGQSYFNERHNFGSIDLYEFLTSEDPEQLFAQAVDTSHNRLHDRIRKRVSDSESSLRRLNEITDQLVSDHDGVRDVEHSPEDFEKDVFYVLKFMFRYSERLGRVGKNEPDGCLLIPLGENEHYIAGYDAKLSSRPDGYDIDADEKNKAANYISILNQNSLIRNLKSDEPIDGHIFISNNLNEGQFEYIGESVAEWIKRNNDASHHSPVVFLETDALISLYDVLSRNFDHIFDDPDVHWAFREKIVDELTTDEQYTVFDRISAERVHERVLEERSKGKKNRDAF